jgi:hypothetical protein
MRNARWVVLAVALLTIAVAVATAQRDPSPKYELEILRTPSGIQLECRHGCAWKTLEGNCDEEFPDCTYVVDERGIRVHPDPEALRRHSNEN